jgi:hypothetical protein
MYEMFLGFRLDQSKPVGIQTRKSRSFRFPVKILAIVFYGWHL